MARADRTGARPAARRQRARDCRGLRRRPRPASRPAGAAGHGALQAEHPPGRGGRPDGTARTAVARRGWRALPQHLRRHLLRDAGQELAQLVHCADHGGRRQAHGRDHRAEPAYRHGAQGLERHRAGYALRAGARRAACAALRRRHASARVHERGRVRGGDHGCRRRSRARRDGRRSGSRDGGDCRRRPCLADRDRARRADGGVCGLSLGRSAQPQSPSTT